LTIYGHIEPYELEELVYEKLIEIGITEKSYPINPFEIITREGIILQEVPMDNDNIKGMLVHGPNGTGILINAKRSLQSKRFIGMHELSHHWFHPHETKTVCFEKYSKTHSNIEWQANNAAVYALMPIKLMRHLYASCDGDINYMCDYFSVSRKSMKYRLNELGLIKE